VIDPACGSGAFLNGALDFLINEHKNLDKFRKIYEDEALPLYDIDHKILENNLFGVDINADAVQIAKLSLWLRTAQKGRKLTNLSNNIKCGNSLIDNKTVDENAFIWQNEFPQIMANGGFDIVIGNPPYVDSENMTKNIPNQRDYISNTYEYAKGNWDLLIPFIEKGYKLLNNDGLMAFITSNKWLALNYGVAIRGLAISHLNFMIDCTTERVFDLANVSSVIFGLSKKYSENISIGHTKNSQIEITKNINIKNIKKLIENNLSLIFSKNINVIAKLYSFPKLGLNYNVFGSFTTAEAYLLSDFIENKQFPTTNDFKLINTGTIDKFLSLWGYNPIKYLGKSLQYPVVNKEIFKSNFSNRYDKLSKEKIIITGIRYFEAFIDKNNSYLPAKSTISITGKLDELYYLVCLLNSKVISYYIYQNYYSSSMGGGINFTPDLVKELPIPNIPNNFESFINLADRLIELNSNLQSVKSEFLRELNLEKIPQKLAEFENLEFDEFIKEYAKAKKEKFADKLAEVNFKNYYQGFFSEYKSQVLSLKSQISQNENELNSLVFALYDLSADEIALIENS